MVLYTHKELSTVHSFFFFLTTHFQHTVPLLVMCPLGGDKVSMFTHTCPHKHLRKINGPSAITRLTAHIMSGLMSDLAICKRGKEHGHT